MDVFCKRWWVRILYADAVRWDGFPEAKLPRK